MFSQANATLLNYTYTPGVSIKGDKLNSERTRAGSGSNLQTGETPLRRCRGCFRQANKYTLLRFYLDEDHNLAFDPEYRAGGYGIYTCPNSNCIRRMLKKVHCPQKPEKLIHFIVNELQQVLNKKVMGAVTSGAAVYVMHKNGTVELIARTPRVGRQVENIRLKLKRLMEDR